MDERDDKASEKPGYVSRRISFEDVIFVNGASVKVYRDCKGRLTVRTDGRLIVPKPLAIPPSTP